MADLFDIMKAKGLEVPKSVESKCPDKKGEKKNTSEKGSDIPSRKIEVVFYKLPLILYYAGSEHRIETEEYPNTESLTREQLLSHIQQQLGYRIVTEKRTTLEYVNESNEVIVHLNNPSKGCSFGLRREKFSDGSIRFVRTDGYGTMIGPAEDTHNEVSLLDPSEGIHLTNKVPFSIIHQIIEKFLDVYPLEHLAQIYYNRKTGEFILHFPKQSTTQSKVQRSKGSFYLNNKDVVLFSEIHSHGRHPAVFSPPDDENEVDYLLYGVLGSLDRSPKWLFRLGFGGAFTYVDAADVFEFSNMEV